MRAFAWLCGSLSLLLLAACGPSVDCDPLCQRLFACDTTFVPPDDPDESKVTSGERTRLESCILGCEVHPAVTVEHARCVDALDVGTPDTCQAEVLDCLGLSDLGAVSG